jgi:hypothetical protein
MSGEITGKSLTYVEADLDVYRATIFENAPVAAGLPLNWTAPNSANHAASVVADASMPSGKALRVVKTAGNLSTFVWTAPPAIRGASAIALFKRNSAAGTYGVCLRSSGGDGTDNLYFAVFSDGANIVVGKTVAGVVTSSATVAFAHATGESIWMRFDALDVTGGVLLRAKVWRGEVEDEPEAFVASFMETVTVLPAGGNGVLTVLTNSPDFVVGAFRVRSLFSNAVETLRFARSTSYLPPDIDAIPSLLEVQVSPGAISLGENLGERATVTAAFKDHKHADLGEMFERGTFWGKFRGRQLFRRGEPIRVVRGLLGQSLASMESRHFVLDSFSGPTFTGAFQLVGKDPLKLADDDRALAPRPSGGFLIQAILAGDPGLTLSPGGIGNTEYPTTGYVAIGGKEIVAFTRGGNDSSTKILLHFDGTNLSTTFTDNNAGGAAHTWTAAGNAKISTTTLKFGTASGLFDGNGDLVTTPDSADFTLGAGNFTVDFWFNCTAVSGGGGNHKYLCGVTDASFTAAGSSFGIRRDSGAPTLIFSVSDGSSIQSAGSLTQFTDVLNAGWHHCAFVRSGNTLRVFIDGILESTSTFTGTIPDTANSFVIGGRNSGTTTEGWQGSIDEFRLSVGVARWTANFTPPLASYISGNDVLSIIRAQFGTTAVDHQSEDRVQLCLNYVAQTPATIISDLLINYAAVPPAYVPTADWQLECDTFLDRLYTKLIADPAGVQELVSKMIQQAGLAMWWDSVAQEIKLQVLRGVPTDSFLYDQSNVLSGSISVQEQPDKRITQVWTYYGVRNPLSPLDQLDNYRSGLVTVDLETESLNGGAVIKTIYADWIPAFGRQTAQRVNDLQIGRFKNPPRQVAFDVMRYSGVTDPQLGGGYLFNYWGAQDELGGRANVPIQVTRLNPMADRFRVEAEEMLFTQQSAVDLINRVILFDGSINNVNLKSVHDSIYPALTALDVTNGVNLTVIVGSGVTIGSTSLGAAFNVGTGWPVGFLITFQNMGTIAGKGGTGGHGHIQTGPFGGTPGTVGGTAFFTLFPISLDNTGGTIGGGGGGGGAGGFHNFGNDDDNPGGGGGGGAGLVAGTGGLPGHPARANPGSAGTLLTGGAGGTSFGSGVDGGAGGNLGSTGGSGNGNMASAPGAAGAAIDGISHVTVVHAGTILGAQIN